jgi:hypothetical protein
MLLKPPRGVEFCRNETGEESIRILRLALFGQRLPLVFGGMGASAPIVNKMKFDKSAAVASLKKRSNN